MAEMLTARGAAFKRFADAIRPLLPGLDDGQKLRFGLLSHRFRYFAFWHGDERGGFGPRRAEFGGPGRE